MGEVPDTGGGEGREAQLSRLALAQHGAVSLRQLRMIGFSERWVQRAAVSGRLTRVHQGIYVVGLPTGRLEQRCAAARLAGGRRSAVSHTSAAALLGIVRDDGGPVHLTLPTARADRAGLRFHRGTLEPEQTDLQHGIRITGIDRTLVDLADLLTPDALERALSEAHRLGHIDRHALPPTPRGRRGLAALGHPRMTRSGLERRFLRLLREAGDLPMPLTNVPLLGYEADAYWPEWGVVVEIDHYATHGDRLAFERDRRKRNHYTLHGLLVLQVTEETLPVAVAAVRAALASRGHRAS